MSRALSKQPNPGLLFHRRVSGLLDPAANCILSPGTHTIEFPQKTTTKDIDCSLWLPVNFVNAFAAECMSLQRTLYIMSSVNDAISWNRTDEVSMRLFFSIHAIHHPTNSDWSLAICRPKDCGPRLGTINYTSKKEEYNLFRNLRVCVQISKSSCQQRNNSLRTSIICGGNKVLIGDRWSGHLG